MLHSWLDRAACRDHPVLSPDAWFEVINAAPKGQGAEAMMVCRYVCPVMNECRANYQGIEAIAGGGWFDAKGQFYEPDEDLLDANQAAAYLGVRVDRVRRIMGGALPIAAHKRGRAWFRLEDVHSISKRYGPPHGSMLAYRLHELKGEQPCPMCQTIDASVSACAS